jgi:serine/threonine protein phosphatase PrpC
VRVFSAGKTDRGYVRTNNEDGLFIDNDLGVFAVADGMGGHKAGEIASRVTLDALRDTAMREQKGDDSARTLTRALQTAGLRIFSATEQEPELRGMGTTLTAMLIHDSTAHIGHVGDSRCYRWRGERLELLTEDHSWVWEQRRAGLISESESLTHPMRNVITRSVGHGGESNADIFPIDIQPGDLYVLCSDGLCGYVPDEEIANVVRVHAPEPQAVVDGLIAKALEYGGEDNVTIVVVKVEN